MKEWLIQYAPTIVSMLGMILTAWKTIKQSSAFKQGALKSMTELKEELSASPEIKQIGEQLKVLLSDNAALKKQNRELLTQLRRIKGADDDGNNETRSQ